MPPRKRKSESATVAEEGTPVPAKKAAVEEPVTGEKRKRGRPRKYPEGSAPKPPPGPKRGRGRPRKDGATTPATPKATPKGEGKRGRPRKYPIQNGADSSTQPANSASADAKTEDDDSGRSYWLMKAEPESRLEKGVDVKFSIDDLRTATKPEPWDGVRNFVARNHIREMKKGDYAFFYHSNCKIPGVVGMMEIVQEHSPDESAFDPAHPYYDEKSNRDDPKWDVVHVEFRRKFKNIVTLNDLKSHAKPGEPLENLQTLKQSRLSVSPVTPAQWKFIMKLAEGEGEGELEKSEEDLSKDESSGADEEEAESSE